MPDKKYCYPPDYTVLKNKLNIQDQKTLDKIERQFARNRMEQGSPTGDFDLAHLQAIHNHLFQDVYEWAGELRQVEISKGESHFLARSRIDMGMGDVHKRITTARYYEGSSPHQFAESAAEIIGDINYIHPFREGNGRTQLQYLEQLGDKAGHKLDLAKLTRDEWIKASIKAQDTDYTAMFHCIFSIIEGSEYLKD